MTSNIKYFIKNIKERANKAVKNELATTVSFNVVIINGNKSKLMFERIPAKTLNQQVTYIIDTEKPDKVKVDIYNEDGVYIDGNIFETVKSEPLQISSFQGLGEAEISHIVDMRMAEKQKAAEFDELKKYTKELITENEQLQEKVQELEENIDELENELEKKSEIRYYAGLVGDILENFGVSKERIRKPLQQLMGIEGGQQQQQQQPKQIQTYQDSSGIVEEETTVLSPEEEKKRETIQLIADYLNNVPIKLLKKIFSIFSDIEQDSTLADYLIDCINNRNLEPQSDDDF